MIESRLPLKFEAHEELLKYLSTNSLHGLDSEYTATSRALIQEFGAKGMDLNSWWVSTPEDWLCPCCQRAKRAIVRLNQHNFLTGHLHDHHDHMEDHVEKRFREKSESLTVTLADKQCKDFIKRTALALSAYDRTVICSDCNNADTRAKKLVKAPPEFSFSPGEIAQFIVPTLNADHTINKVCAMRVWQEAKVTFDTRSMFIEQIAELGARNTHWYQFSKQTSEDVVRSAQSFIKRYGLDRIKADGVPIYPPEQALYETNKFKGNSDSWRRKKKPRGRSIGPTQGEVGHMMALSHEGALQLDNDWICSGCSRSKYQCFRKSNQGKWSMPTEGERLFFSDEGDFHLSLTVCNDCLIVARNLVKEVTELTGIDTNAKTAIIRLTEVRSIIEPMPHLKHSIYNDKADTLLPLLMARIRRLSQGEDYYNTNNNPNA